MAITAAELIFKIQATGTDQLKAVAVAVDAVKQGTQLAGAQLKTFDATLNALVKSGKTFQQALEEMAASEGVLATSIRSTAAELLSQLPAVKAAEAAAKAKADADKAAARAAAELAAANKAGLLSLQQLGYGTGVVNYQILNLARGFSGLTGAIGVTGTVAAGAVIGFGALTLGTIALVTHFGSAEREIANLASRLGISVTEAEKLTAEAQITGVSITAIEASARLLEEALEHPDEQGKKTAKSLQALGVSTGDLKGNMADMGTVVLQVLDKLSQIPDTAKRVALGQELLGRGSKQLEPLIANYAELKRVVESIHVGDNVAALKELEDANKAVVTLDLAWQQFWKHIAEHTAPIVIPVLRAITPDDSSNPLDPSVMS